jgi:molecular chaperone IbpA
MEDNFSNIKKRLGLHLLGLDDFLDKALKNEITYPPYNILKTSEESLLIDIAVAGFLIQELNVFRSGNQLLISGKKKPEEKNYLHKGIATRSFRISFMLLDDMIIASTEYKNGILSIEIRKPLLESSYQEILISNKD